MSRHCHEHPVCPHEPRPPRRPGTWGPTLALVAALLATFGCSSDATGPAADLSGVWVLNLTGSDDPADIPLSLTDSGLQVTGSTCILDENVRLGFEIVLDLDGLVVIGGSLVDGDWDVADVACSGDPDDGPFVREVTGGTVNEAGTRIDGTWADDDVPPMVGTFTLERL